MPAPRARNLSRAEALRSLRAQRFGERPIGTCKVDKVAQTSFKKGIFLVRLELQQLREEVERVASQAFQRAVDMLIRWPDEDRLAGQVFDDLKLIRLLLKRSQQLDAGQLGGCIGNRDAAERFQTYLKTTDAVIAEFLSRHEETFKIERSDKASIRARNFDAFTFFLIEDAFHEIWCRLRLLTWDERAPSLGKTDQRAFVRFLAAAWADLNLPMEDHRGHSREPLEVWLADRVRKHFRHAPSGI